MSNSSSFRDLLPLLLLGGDHQDMLPLLLLLGQNGARSSSSSTSAANEDSSSSTSTIPTTFLAYAAGLVGDVVRLSLSTSAYGATILIGRLEAVGTDFFYLRDVIAGGVSLGFRDRMAIESSAVVAIDRFPFLLDVLPLLLQSGMSLS